MLTVTVTVMPKKGVLDPQGKTIADTLNRLGFENVKEARQGKSIVLQLDETDQEKAKEQALQMCKKLLVNEVVEEGAIVINA